MKATKSARFWSGQRDPRRHIGIVEAALDGVVQILSVGRVPVGVERHLNLAATKLRGKIFRYGAFSPLPSPRKPWHPQQ